MTITLSDPALNLARQQAADAGYADVAAYLESLIEQADARRADRADTIAAVREGLADVEAGRVRPAQMGLEAIAQKYGLPPLGG